MYKKNILKIANKIVLTIYLYI